MTDFTLPIIALCRCWTIERTDGFKLGFTDHDEAIAFDDVICYPNYGGTAASREYSNEAGSADNTEIDFAFDSNAITESDLLGGKYEDAKFAEYVVDWGNIDSFYLIAYGHFGKMTVFSGRNNGQVFKLEMRSLSAKLQQKNNEVTVKLCPKVFGSTGDNLCNKDLSAANLIDTLSVTAVEDNRTFTVDSNRTTTNYYGEVTFTSGDNNGYVRYTSYFSGTDKQIVLWEALPNAPGVGDTLTAKARCDKSLNACVSFNNAVNHGGFPNIPGNDQLIKTDRL